MFSLTPWKKRSNGGSLKVRDPASLCAREEEFHPLSQLRQEFDALWDRFLRDFNQGLTAWDEDIRFGLQSGLEDRENEYVFHADLPGFEPDEIDVKLSGNTLAVKAEHKEEKKGDEGSSYRYGAFQRYFTLPYGVDEQKIDATYHSGVLEVHLPKTEKAQGKRIAVQAK